MGDEVRIGDGALSAAEDFQAAGQNAHADFAVKVQAAQDVFGLAEWAGDDHAGHAFRSAIKPDLVNDQLGPARVDSNGEPLNAAGATQAVADLGAATVKIHKNSLDSDSEQAAVMSKAHREVP